MLIKGSANNMRQTVGFRLHIDLLSVHRNHRLASDAPRRNRSRVTFLSGPRAPLSGIDPDVMDQAMVQPRREPTSAPQSARRARAKPGPGRAGPERESRAGLSSRLSPDRCHDACKIPPWRPRAAQSRRSLCRAYRLEAEAVRAGRCVRRGRAGRVLARHPVERILAKDAAS